MSIYNYSNRFDEAASYLCDRLSSVLLKLPDSIKSRTHEIRLRAGRPISLTLADKCLCINEFGQPYDYPAKNSLIATIKDIEITLSYICEMSVYSYTSDICEGFITIRGGHRAGICGKAVLDNGKIISVKDISSINIRIAREIKDCAAQLMPYIVTGKVINGCLISSPPGGGKTTVLRDIARSLSLAGKKLSVIDERGELGATYLGIPQNDMGAFCDILDGYPKAQGIMQAIRTLSPDVILCDEIGGEDDVKAIIEGMNAGVPIIATVHASDYDEAIKRPQINRLLKSGAIKIFILLYGREKPCVIKNVYKVGEYRDENSRFDYSVFRT